MAHKAANTDREPVALREEWIDHIRRTKAAPTLVAYRHQIRTFHAWLGDIAEWDDVETEDVFGYLSRERARTARPAKASIDRDTRILRNFFRWLNDRGVLTLNPMVTLETPRGIRPEPREPVSDELWLKIWNGPTVTVEDRVWLGLGYFCGLRRQEMALLQPDGVRPRSGRHEPGTLAFLRKGGAKRSGLAYRSIIDTLTDPDTGLPHLAEGGADWMDLLEILARLRAGEMFLLSTSTADVETSCRRLYDRFRAIQRDAGVPPEEWTTLHCMRHSAATNLVLCGLEAKTIQRQLSHSSEQMTERYITTSKEIDRWREREKRLRAPSS